MLGWLLLGALLTAAVITICVSYLDKKVAKEKLKGKSIRKGVVKEYENFAYQLYLLLSNIEYCTN